MPRHPEVGAAKVRKLAGKDERRERVAEIRAAVFARAGESVEELPRCEAWLEPHTVKPRRCDGVARILDHWLGGLGRRRPQESVATCWALCLVCDNARTRNRPDAEWWNASHKRHCAAHGYTFTPHYDARAASRRTA
jgi:hypothetical protein